MKTSIGMNGEFGGGWNSRVLRSNGGEGGREERHRRHELIAVSFYT